MMKIVLSIFIITQLSFIFSQTKVKPITTYLNAKWHDTPFILECAEYLADENPATYWSFIELINKSDLKAYKKKNDKEKFEHIINVARNFLTQSQISLLKFSLSLRVFSPKIESFNQIALDRQIHDLENCDTVVDINENLVCDPSQIGKHIKNAGSTKPVVFDVDHIYPAGVSNDVTAILYGELGTENMAKFHDILKKYSESGDISYIYRPFVKVQSPRKLRLSGYGVELQIKSTEYKAQDDTKVQEDSGADGDDDDPEQEVEGFIFSKLKDLHPKLTDSLNQLKSHLLESAHEMAPLKVWQLQHLSMQAAHRIMSAPNEEMLSLFTHTAQNFPSLARSLTRTKFDDKMKKEILKNQNLLQSQSDISPSDAALFINGMHFDLDYTDIYTLLEHVKNEQRVMEGLFKLGLKGSTLSQLLNLDLTSAKTEYGVDIRDSAIFWLNDIEKDA
ncbi:UNVERIFIED_CONTAM: hypothetical protein GTU68_020422, partial [Idotea baltica]|nr:hypothetical protein [Idotea baltica]